jgi:crotonobetainyl-CoA:carnitine CoA-transferase CaiB-like acyl-CoA transferase
LDLHALRKRADITISSLPLAEWEQAIGSQSSRTSGSVVVHISSFGRTGPRRERQVDGLILQALSGWPRRVSPPGEPPLPAGGDVDAYGTGVYAAVGAMTAQRVASAQNQAVEVDVSAFECVVSMMPYPTLVAEVYEMAGVTVAPIVRSLPGVVPVSDGWVGINPLSQAGWNDFCEVADLTEFRNRLPETLRDSDLADRFANAAERWLGSQTGDEVVELMQAMRIPSSRVFDGSDLPAHPQLMTRKVFATQPGASFLRPRSPWHFSASSTPSPRQAPRLGEMQIPQSPVTDFASADRDQSGRRGPEAANLPYAGLRIIDLSAYWAGPLATLHLASLGADVIKVESHRRPDPFRYSTSSPQLGEDWWERSAVWQGVNRNKRSLTLDLSHFEGQRIIQELLAHADVLVENFSPRVLAQLGLDPEALMKKHPGLIVLRLPGFGLDGPFRDHLAWAPTFEQASGLAAATLGPGGRPTPPGGCADPLGGMHGLLGLLAALEHRDRTGQGQVLEMAQLEAMVSVTANQVIDASTRFEEPATPDRYHPPRAPHGIFPCEGTDEWIAISVDQATWPAFAILMNRRDLLEDPTLASVQGRYRHHHEIYKAIVQWTVARTPLSAEVALLRAGVDAAIVARSESLLQDNQLKARGFFEKVDRPASGCYHYPTLPMLFSFDSNPEPSKPAPTLGQHTADILESLLGLGPDAIAGLYQQGVSGTRPGGAD